MWDSTAVPVTLYGQLTLMMVIYNLHTQGPRFVESHICQNRADMGHPSFVTQEAVGLIWVEHPSRTEPLGTVIESRRPKFSG